jgi:type I restriction enzyme S subunit
VSWPKPQLQEFCRIIQGGRSGLSGNDFVPEGFPAYGAGGLNGYLPTHEFEEPAVILSSIGARCGKCFYAEGKWASMANTQLIFPDTTKADVRFLWIQLNDESRWHRSGTGQPFIKPSDVKTHRVLLPPLAEQRRIAEVLDRAEALRAKRRAVLAQLDSLTQSLFLDLFGDPASNPKGWSHKTLFNLGKVVTGGTPPSAKAGMFDGPIPFVTPGDLESDEPVKRSLTPAGAEESRTVRAGATLVCCIGATIGKMGVARVRSAFNQQLNAVEWTREIDDLYGYATLRFFKPTIKTWGASTTLPILKKSSFEKIEIPVPPLPLQQEFSRRFQATEKLRAAQKQSLTELDELFAALQHRAFKGEL